MKTITRQSIMWISVSAAVITGIIITESAACICAFLIPALIDIAKTATEEKQ